MGIGPSRGPSGLLKTAFFSYFSTRVAEVSNLWESYPVNFIYSPQAVVPGSSQEFQWSWLVLEGPDAQDFLHRLTTVHVKALTEGKGSPGCFLTPQGKIRSFFYLWRIGPTEYAFEFDPGNAEHWKTQLLTVIDQYTFGEKIQIRDPGFSYLWLFPKTSSFFEDLSPGQTRFLQEEEMRVCHHGDTQFGKSWITLWGDPAKLTAFKEKLETAKAPASLVESWRILALNPRVDHEITESVMPLEIGLIDSIASQKGCYPGQEVIEKVISLGSPSKRLCLIEGQGPSLQIGDPLWSTGDSPVEIGKISSLSTDGQAFQALGLIRKTHTQVGTPVQLGPQRSTQGVISKVAL